MRSLHTDISTVTGERIVIFTLDGAPRFTPSDGDAAEGPRLKKMPRHA
jgi:hypothetical protein